ncbi:MAG: Fe-S-cluster-containing hydrogenase component 2/CRP-like cAMP-binding protein [Planctomycetota bacterium]|jgi:Fe-S-cluster-containing hydrogenase component 2/CRP-like cAMP-binding protein
MAAQTDNSDVLAQLGRLAPFADLGEETKQNKKQRAALLEFHRFEDYSRGEVIIEQGEFTGEFCVVISGSVAVFRSEDGSINRLGNLGSGEWFGEMSALSFQAAVAQVRSESRALVLVIDQALFKTLYEAAKGKSAFKAAIDEKYRQRALSLHLRVAPLLAELSVADLESIGQRAELVRFEEGDVVAEQGVKADAVYLIRSGAVKEVRRDEKGSERVHSYYRGNSSVGENCLAREDVSWRGTLTAMTPTDVVKIPVGVFLEIFGATGAAAANESQTLSRLRLAADRIAAEDRGVETGGSTDELDVMVGAESAKGGKALVIDLDKCTRCNACVESCVAAHEDGIPRLSKKGNRISSNKVLSSACYSCEIPDCMQSCDFGAIRRDVNGSIRFIYDNCTGCTLCVPACPYDVIRMTPPPNQPDSRPPGFLESIPFLGKLLAPKRPEEIDAGEKVLAARTQGAVAGKAIKCDLCAGLPYEACVYNCPCGAIDRFDPAALFAGEESK